MTVIHKHARRRALFERLGVHLPGQGGRRMRGKRREERLQPFWGRKLRHEGERMRGRRLGAVDPRVSIQGGEQLGRCLRRFGRAQEQETSRFEGVMEYTANLLLEAPLEIDQ